MKILKITEYTLEFDNGKDIRYDHEQDCCEVNYADCEQLDSLARELISVIRSRLNHATMVSDSETRQ